MRLITNIMAGPKERQRLIDAARAAVLRAKTICAEAEIACEGSQSIRGFHVREKVMASRVLNPRGAARLKNDLERASRDLEMLKARIESVNPATPSPRSKRRR